MPPARKIDPERARRLRAARVYLGKKHEDVRKETGISETTISRIENAKTAPDARQVETLINAYEGVPLWFFEHGFEAQPVPEEPTLVERVEALEGQMATLVKRLGSDGPPPPPSELFQPPGGRQPKPGSEPGDASDRAGGSQ